MNCVKLICIVLFVTLSTAVCAEITIRPMVIYFKANGSPYKDILIRNQSDSPAYVDIQAARLLNPGVPQVNIQTAHNPKDLGLLVTPIRSKLDARQGKSVRVSILQPPGEKERDYRLWVRPLPSRLTPTGDKPTSPQMYLQVLTAYYVYVHVLPVKPVSKVMIKRQGKHIVLENVGNVLVELRNGKQCKAKGQCELLPKKTLYPESTWQLTGKVDLPATFDVYVDQRFLETVRSS